MALYLVELNNGYVTLSASKRQAVREEGTANIKRIAPATPEQIEWVRAMGGHVPAANRRTI